MIYCTFAGSLSSLRHITADSYYLKLLPRFAVMLPLLLVAHCAMKEPQSVTRITAIVFLCLRCLRCLFFFLLDFFREHRIQHGIKLSPVLVLA